MVDAVTRTLSFFMIIAFPGGYTKTPEKVAGATPAKVWEFPHQVSLRAKGEHFCGGSIIDQFHVLTAASCVVLEPGVFRANIEILTGTVDVLDVSRGELFRVSHMNFHEGYDPENFWINDIAVLTLTEPIPFSLWCGPVSLPDRLNVNSEGLFAVGWGGKISATMMTQRYLQKAKITLHSREKCNELLQNFHMLHPNQGCFKVVKYRLSTTITKGDGGGPVYLPPRRILGILSINNMMSFAPTIYTQVYPYNQWILNALVY